MARLELLAKDASLPAGGVLNYGRPSNGQTDATSRPRPAGSGGREARLARWAGDGPAPKVLPDRPGAALAPGYGR